MANERKEEGAGGSELLRTCKACGKTISRHSPFCRHCGHPQADVLTKWIIVGGALLMLLLSLAVFFVLQLSCQFGR